MSKHTRAVLLLKTIIVFTVILSSAQLIPAQSGRRAKPKATSVPAPTPEPEPTPKPREEIPPAYTMIVGIERELAFDYSASTFFDIVLKACSDRLDRSPSVRVQSSQQNLMRSEAIKAAKDSTDAHVVWLKLSNDMVGADSSANGAGIVIEFSVYAPTTGKLVTSGRSHQVQPRGGIMGGIPPGGRDNQTYREYLIKEAAEKAAERILSSLSLPARSIPRFAAR